MSEKKITAEQFVRNVLATSFKQTVDQDTLREVAEKVRQAVDTKPKLSRDREAA